MGLQVPQALALHQQKRYLNRIPLLSFLELSFDPSHHLTAVYRRIVIERASAKSIDEVGYWRAKASGAITASDHGTVERYRITGNVIASVI